MTQTVFQGLKNHMWLVATIWTQVQSIITESSISAVLDKIQNVDGAWKHSLNTSGCLLTPLTKPPMMKH